MKINLDRPWLIADLDRPKRVLSWALNRPGLVMADRVVWREVKNADLPVELDAAVWFREELLRNGYGEAVGLLTSRNINHYTHASAKQDGVKAEVLATVGLSNAVRVGASAQPVLKIGTINITVEVSEPLSEAAQIEALSIVAQARTAAVMTYGPDVAEGRATGTGTDCIAIACEPGKVTYAGLHTAIGQTIGKAVLDAVGRGVQDWMKENAKEKT